MSRMTDVDPEQLAARIRSAVGEVIIGNETIVDRMCIALLSRGHVLLEGVPGTAKTSLANAFAQVTGLEYSRIQMTPDLLPSDITGTNVYRENLGKFEISRGPVFSNIVVADEINRATPKTQSSLLEAMQERRVTIGETTFTLPAPFMVVATQNPLEMQGVFELPEAQRDRFQLKLTIDAPTIENERKLLDRFDDSPDLVPEQLSQVVTREELTEARNQVKSVYVDPKVKEYILSVVTTTRTEKTLAHGASPRAAIALMNACKARAAIMGRNYAIPEDVTELAGNVLAHRLVLSSDAEYRDRTPTDVMASIVEAVDIPQDDSGNSAAQASVAEE